MVLGSTLSSMPKTFSMYIIDRRRKLPCLVNLLRALGYTKEDLLAYFYDIERVFCKGVNGEIKWFKETPLDLLLTQIASETIEVDGKPIVKKGKKILKKHLKKLEPLMTKGTRTILGSEKKSMGLMSSSIS